MVIHFTLNYAEPELTLWIMTHGPSHKIYISIIFHRQIYRIARIIISFYYALIFCLVACVWWMNEARALNRHTWLLLLWKCCWDVSSRRCVYRWEWVWWDEKDVKGKKSKNHEASCWVWRILLWKAQVNDFIFPVKATLTTRFFLRS